jgi:hypothetical protein
MRTRVPLLEWLLVPTTLGLLVLLALTLATLRHRATGMVPPVTNTPALRPLAGASQVHDYFSWPATVRWLPPTNTANPFFTLAIQVSHPGAPAASPLATKKIDLIYRGFFETSKGVRRALIQVAEQQVLSGLGEKVVADYVAVDIALRHLNLTNPAGKTVKLEFALPQQLEVPAQ